MDKSFADLLKRHRSFLIPFLILVLICSYLQFTNSKAELFFWTNIRHNPFFDEFFVRCTMIGDPFTMVLVTVGMLFIKYRYAVLIGLAYAYSQVIVQILKRIFNSPRPSKFFEGLNPIRTIQDYPLYEWNSFPSGHSTSAFALAVVLSYLLPYKRRHWIIIPIAILTAFSRVYLSQHFFQDVFAGAVLGVVLTFQLIWWLENTEWYHSARLDGKLFGKLQD
ncbi:MAG: phosphatase PAP2 family protein [Daejeonella sp.]